MIRQIKAHDEESARRGYQFERGGPAGRRRRYSAWTRPFFTA